MTADATAKPVWFLDIDGTIGPFGEHRDDITWAPAALYDRGPNLLSVPYYPQIVTRIQSMHVSGLVDVQSLTTWDPDMVVDWERVGLGPFAYTAPVKREEPWPKAAAVKAWLDEHPDGRAVWTDDQSTEDRTPPGYYRDRLLVIVPDDQVGLTQNDRDVIAAWLKDTA